MSGWIKPVAPIASVSVPVAPSPADPLPSLQGPESPAAPSPLPLARDVPQSPLGVGPVRHERLPSSNREVAARTGIYRLDVDLYEGRILFLSRSGPPFRGYVTTDLEPGAYRLTVDVAKKLWFIRDTAKPGLRFTVDLDGPDPFEFQYEPELILTVSAGLQSSANIDSVVDAIDTLDDLSNGARWLYLAQLSETLLYDALDQLWSGETYGQKIIMDLLSGFEAAAQLSISPADMLRVLRAIESFTVKPSDLFVDAFTSYMLYPASREPDEDRKRMDLSTVQIRFVYAKWPPVRSLVVYADDIFDSDRNDPDPPVYGAGSLTYPKWLTRTTAPRIYAAKKAILDQVENENLVEIIEQAHGAFEEIQMAWTIYGLAEPLIAGLLNFKTVPDKWAGSGGAARAEGAPWRWKGIQPAIDGPGVWVADFEGGANMTIQNAYYQLDAAGTPPGWGYRCGGLQFENFLNGMLVDAKDWAYWGNVGRSMRGLSSSEIALAKIRQAEAQLTVARAAKVGVEWRVSSSELIPTIRKGLDAHGLSEVRLAHYPLRPPPPGWQLRAPTRLFR